MLLPSTGFLFLPHSSCLGLVPPPESHAYSSASALLPQVSWTRTYQEATKIEVQLLILRASCMPCTKLNSRNAKSTKKDNDPFLCTSPGFPISWSSVLSRPCPNDCNGWFVSQTWMGCCTDASYCRAKVLCHTSVFWWILFENIAGSFCVHETEREQKNIYLTKIY